MDIESQEPNNELNNTSNATSTSQRILLGRTSVSSNEASTVNEFPFWVAERERVEVMDYVTVNKNSSQTVGVVTRLEHRTDAKDHLDNWAASNFGNAQTPLAAARLSATVAYAKVMHNTNEEYMPLLGDLSTYTSTPQEILTALGTGSVPDEEQICFGLINQSSSTFTKAIGDIRYVLGGEGAHVSISGISGLATKSSYAMFLVEQIHYHQKYGDSTAIVVVNVKQDDLLHLHEIRGIKNTSQGRQLAAQSDKIRASLGLPLNPYDPRKVHYLLPLGPNGGFNVYREPSMVQGVNNKQLYAYDQSDLPRILPFLFSRIIGEGGWESGEALIYDLSEEIQSELAKGKNVDITGSPANPGNIYNLIDGLCGKGKPHDDRTGKKFNKHWKRLIGTGATGANSGLLVNRRTNAATSLDNKLTQMQKGHIYVIDIAKLSGEEQQMVFGDILSSVDECLSKNYANKPEKVVVVFDELNKYAPASGRSRSTLTDLILDVAERGRSAGLCLIGAAQFNSAVHNRVVGNSSTKVLGRTDSGELGDVIYKHLDTDIKLLVSRLNKGEMVLSHPLYRQPVKVRFPIPSFNQPGS